MEPHSRDTAQSAHPTRRTFYTSPQLVQVVAAKLIWFVAFLSTASHRAARGNNDRLSTPWRKVISLAGIARSFSKASSCRNVRFRDRHADTMEDRKGRRVDMQSNNVIEIVTPWTH
jgi:hypothetical protein